MLAAPISSPINSDRPCGSGGSYCRAQASCPRARQLFLSEICLPPPLPPSPPLASPRLVFRLDSALLPRPGTVLYHEPSQVPIPECATTDRWGRSRSRWFDVRPSGRPARWGSWGRVGETVKDARPTTACAPERNASGIGYGVW